MRSVEPEGNQPQCLLINVRNIELIWFHSNNVAYRSESFTYFFIANAFATIFVMHILPTANESAVCILIFYIFCLDGFQVGLNTWLWSTVFHARDFPLTEVSLNVNV